MSADSFAFHVAGFLGAMSVGLGCSWQPARQWCSWREEWHAAQPLWTLQGSHLAGTVWDLCRGGREERSLRGGPDLRVPHLLLVLNHVL